MALPEPLSNFEQVVEQTTLMWRREWYSWLGRLVSAISAEITALQASITSILATIAGFNAVWSSYTPVVTASSGTITSYTASGRFKQNGKTVVVQMRIVITNPGSAVGYVLATLPVAAVTSSNQTGSSQETNAGGKGGASFIPALDTGDGSVIFARAADLSTYFATNAIVLIGISYEVP
jgi:hypothetical protein